jgi:small subunit ribosomal protein S1
VSELSWKHVDHPSEVVEVGQEVKVEVLDVDLERERVSLSLKATQEDPWRQFAREHEVGDIIEGRVTKLVPFGAFVEVDDAIEGLVHISELAAHHVERPEDEVSVHDRVEVKIIDIDLDRRRISLSRKQTMPEAVSSAIPEAEGGAPDAASASASDVVVAPEAAEMELEARETSEAAGVATEDTIARPETERELASAVEGAPELLDEPIAPEAASNVEEAVAAAPDEEKEQAELTSLMSPDSPPEAQAGILPDEPQERDLDKRLNQEEPDEGAAPGESAAELEKDEVPLTEGAADLGAESLEPGDETGDESIESIVQDLKRQSKKD